MTGKGPLCVALVISRQVKDSGLEFPLSQDSFLAESGGQVAGLGKASVQSILASHGINRVLAKEGGRTSRGSIDNMRRYVAFLNTLHESNQLDLEVVENFWVEKVKLFFAAQPLKLRLDPATSIQCMVQELIAVAFARQAEQPGTMVAGTVLQHLIGAKLAVALPDIEIFHHGASVADAPTARSGDFLIGTTAVHVTTAPGESLLEKCAQNLSSNLRPLIITTPKGVDGALALAENAGLCGRVEVLEVGQFVATNVFEWTGFDDGCRPDSIKKIVDQYNIIIENCETDPSLRIDIGF